MRFNAPLAAAAFVAALGSISSVSAHFSNPGSSSCSGNTFSWNSPITGDCCITKSAPHDPGCPSTKECPANWSWSSKWNCCVPQLPNLPPVPSCPSSGAWWDHSKQCCNKPPSGGSTTTTTPKPAPPPPTSTSKTSTATSTSSVAPPPPSSGGCDSGHFPWWSKPSGNCCLPHGGQPKPPSCPPTKECPKDWEWNNTWNICVPHFPNPPPTPGCPSPGSTWNDGDKCCHLPPPPPAPTTTTTKTSTSTSTTKTSTSTTKTSTSTSATSTPSPPPGGCASTQFPWDGPQSGHCCLPHGGPPTPPSCPPTKECPPDWWWHGIFGCCVPHHPNPPPPSCPNGPWDHGSQCCHKPPTPQPSGTYNNGGGGGGGHHHGGGHKKRGLAAKIASRNWRSKTMSCPGSQSVCNVSDNITKTNTWACVDTMKDVNFCGGCANKPGDGMDCSTIPNSWNTGCQAGVCKVFTCEPGFFVSGDGKSCVQY